LKKIHEDMLYKLQSVIDEMSLLCEIDSGFNSLLGELNIEQNMFGRSLDEYSIEQFIESKKACPCGNDTFEQVDAYEYECTECKQVKNTKEVLY